MEMLGKRYANVAAFNEVWKTGAASWEELADARGIANPFPHKDKAKQNQEKAPPGRRNPMQRRHPPDGPEVGMRIAKDQEEPACAARRQSAAGALGQRGA